MPQHVEDFERIISKGDCCGKAGPLLLMPGCHMNAQALPSYRNGVLTLRCGECRKVFTRVAVATHAKET